MKVLVANLGSTSFKYRLFDLGDPAEPVLARGAIERIGSASAKVVYSSPRGQREQVWPSPITAQAVQLCLDQFTDPEIGVLRDATEVSAIGFKAVHARNLTGVHLVDEKVLAAMEAFADVAPAHNPPYTRAMRMLRERFPRLPLVAAFETGFHRTIPERADAVRHPRPVGDRVRHPALGLSRRQPPVHRLANARAAGARRYQGHLVPPGRKLVALRDPTRPLGRVQPGHEPAVGAAAQQPRGRLRRLRAAGHHARDRQEPGRSAGNILANQSGLEGLSGAGRDLRDIEAAAAAGDARAASGHRRLRRRDPPLPGRLSARARRCRRDRVHRRDRRELGADPLGGLPRARLVRHRARPGAERRRAGRARGLDAAVARAGLDRPDQRRDRGRAAGQSSYSKRNQRG